MAARPPSVSEQSCVAPKAVSVFQPVDRQAFVWFIALQVRSGDQLRVEWLDPAGTVATTAEYGELPSAGELCFTSQLPIAGAAPASQPGNWTVRAVANGAVAFSRTFTIAPSNDNGGPVVTSVTWSGERAQEIDFTVRGKNFQPGSLVLIAQYKAGRRMDDIWPACSRAHSTAESTGGSLRGSAGERISGDRGESGSAHEPADAVRDRDRGLQAADGGGRAVDHYAGAVRNVFALGQQPARVRYRAARGKLRSGDEGGDRLHARSGARPGPPASFLRELHHDRSRQRRIQPLRASGYAARLS